MERVDSQLPNSGPTISHLQFADDVIFLGVWSRSNVSNLLRLLRCYQLSSGLKVNINKSYIMGVGVEEAEVTSFAERVHYKAGRFPFTYLGLPIGASMNKCDSWAPLIEKCRSKLSSWKASILSFGGRLVLAKAVLGSFGIYYLSLFKAPKKIINKLESIRCSFFWGSKQGSKKIAWMNWQSVLANKIDGGLGIGSLQAQNLALLARWWWRFKTEANSLWRKVIVSLHGDDRGFGRLSW